jgi:hypothetical protein
MTDVESQSKFDHLVSAVDMNFDANLLTRVPSLKNMGKLEELWLESNKITRIAPGNVWTSTPPIPNSCTMF